jgi:uncharacterized protein (DUF58 family)
VARRRHVSICKEGWYYIAVLVFITAGAMIRDINLLFMLAGMMLGPHVLSVLLIHTTLRKVTFLRKFPRVIGAGDLLVVDVIGQNDARLGGSWALVVDDQIQKITLPEADDATARLLLAHIPPRGTANAFYRVRLRDRGRYRLGPITVSTRVPMGLMQARQQFDICDEVLVCPQLGRMLPGWKRRLQLSREGGLRSQQRQGRSEGDYFAMRNWRTGDSRRWIHWRTSAKRNQLAVKQFEQTANQDLAVFVDLALGSVPRGQEHWIEKAISLSATIIAEECRQGSSRLVFGAAGQTTRCLRGASSLVFQQEVMEHLAVVQPNRRETLTELLAEALPQIPRESRIVIITTRPLDLRQISQAPALAGNLRIQRLLTSAGCIDVHDPGLAQLFELD